MPDFADLAVSTDKVRFLILKSRQLNAKDVVTEPNPGSNPTDDGEAAVLEDHGNDPTRAEIKGLIGAMNADEKLDLATLAIMGRDDGIPEEWRDLRSETAQAMGQNIANQLLEMPLLGDYLAEGLTKFGISAEE